VHHAQEFHSWRDLLQNRTNESGACSPYNNNLVTLDQRSEDKVLAVAACHSYCFGVNNQQADQLKTKFAGDK
jgi:hypothetical protein